MDLAAFFASLNVLLLVGLVYVYSRLTLRSKAPFTVGLLLFAGFLLVHNLMTVYSFLSMEPFFGEAVLPYLLAISSLEFVGLLALVRVTV
jgi:uncharacterized membrane protein YgdD (TMEM256/DUF423 family)